MHVICLPRQTLLPSVVGARSFVPLSLRESVAASSSERSLLAYRTWLHVACIQITAQYANLVLWLCSTHTHTQPKGEIIARVFLCSAADHVRICYSRFALLSFHLSTGLTSRARIVAIRWGLQLDGTAQQWYYTFLSFNETWIASHSLHARTATQFSGSPLLRLLSSVATAVAL